MDGGRFWAAMAQQLLKFAASKLEESLESKALATAEVGSPAEAGDKQKAENVEAAEESPKPKPKAKATPKAKKEAKAKTEPKPKAKGKAKAKAKAKAEAKGKPAASQATEPGLEAEEEEAEPKKSNKTKQAEPEEGETPALKKQKSQAGNSENTDKEEKPAKLSAAARLKKRADDLLTEPAEQEPADEELQVCEKRDKRKTRFFQANLTKLPESVQKLFLSHEVSRTDKTRLVNESVQVNPTTGKWEFACRPPVFQSLTSSYSTITGSTRDKAYPKAIMIGKCAGEENFLRGLRDGDIEATTENGKQLFKFR